MTVELKRKSAKFGVVLLPDRHESVNWATFVVVKSRSEN